MRFLVLALVFVACPHGIAYKTIDNHAGSQKFYVEELAQNNQIRAHSADVVIRAELPCNEFDNVSLRIDNAEKPLIFFCGSYYIVKHQENLVEINIETSPLPFKLMAVPFPLDTETRARQISSYIPVYIKASATGMIVALTIILSIPSLLEYMERRKSKDVKPDYVPADGMSVMDMTTVEDPSREQFSREQKSTSQKKSVTKSVTRTEMTDADCSNMSSVSRGRDTHSAWSTAGDPDSKTSRSPQAHKKPQKEGEFNTVTASDEDPDNE